MSRYCLKVLWVFMTILLGPIHPAFAAREEPKDAAPLYFDNNQPEDTLASFQMRRDMATQRYREDIFKTHFYLSRDNTDLAKAVIDRKVMIARERGFLETEFRKGVEALYQKAVDQYTQKQASASQKNFEEIERLFPNYKETRHYLQKLKDPVFPT